MAVALDVGTAFLIAARETKKGVEYKSCRDAFFTIRKNSFNIKLLEKQGVDFIAIEDQVHVVGDSAVKLANAYKQTTNRPMQGGVISPKERQAVPMIKEIMRSVLGPTKKKGGELCVYSVPAPPVDSNYDIIYHESVIESILGELGYRGVSINEGQALAYSELTEEDLMTGMACSFGGGMVNVCMIMFGEPVTTFSIARGGDWIDSSVGTALNMRPSAVQYKKETSDIDIQDPQDAFGKAITIYYKSLLKDVASTFTAMFEAADTAQQFTDPIRVVVGGGTSLIKGFLPEFKAALENSGFPLCVKEVMHANQPLCAVANGCLLQAQLV